MATLHPYSFELTPDQQQAKQELSKFLNDPKKHAFLLKGYAGTGKTFLIGELLKMKAFDSSGKNVRNFILTAPTGRAAQVVAMRTGCEASTIHSQIYDLNQIHNLEADVKGYRDSFLMTFSLAEPKGIRPIDVLVIDEASMVSDTYMVSDFLRFGSGYLMKDIFQYLQLGKHNERKIIFIGDPAQLPPVGSAHSPALDAQYIRQKYGLEVEEFTLKEVVRQKSHSGVLDIAKNLRASLESGIFHRIPLQANQRDTHRLAVEQLMRQYLKLGRGQIPQNAVILAYSNAKTLYYNQMVRRHFFPGKKELQPGDRLMIVKNMHTQGIGVTNGELAEVVEVAPSRETRNVPMYYDSKKLIVPLHFRNVKLRITSRDGINQTVFATKIIENLLESPSRGLQLVEQKALYVDFCIRYPNCKPKNKAEEMTKKETLLKDPYFNALQVKYGYAITVHKSQGGEWPHAFVDFSGRLLHNEDAFRWIYTAVTRSSEQLYMLNGPAQKLFSFLK